MPQFHTETQISLAETICVIFLVCPRTEFTKKEDTKTLQRLVGARKDQMIQRHPE